MTATDFYSELTQHGVNVWLDGGALKYRAPQHVITPDLLADLKAHKTELIALLASNDSTAKPDRYRYLVQCQQCANLTLGGGCRMKTGYKPMPDAKRDCGQFEPVQGERQAIADTPYTAAELEDLLARYESRLLAHVVNCPDCRISDRRYCADGFAVGSAYDALLMVFDDADDRHHAFVSRVIRKRLEGCK